MRSEFLILFCFYLFISCNDRKNRPVTILPEVTADSLGSGLDIELMEDGRDRTIWQKPYEVIHLLGSLEGKTIADIGAGSGYFSFRFVNEAGKVIAIDIEPELIQLMDQEKMYYKPEIQQKFEARLATPDDPKLKPSEVDIIFISNTYTLIQNRVNYLKGLIDKFKPGGRIMIVDFKKKLTPIGPTQKNRLAQSEVEQELIDAGYELVFSDDRMLEYQYIIVAQPASNR
jgi:ubiquinone/menaquinone biosynthesis C-methylase UbiE